MFICAFGLAGLGSADQWQAANALWFLGNLSLNVANVFYYAGFPAIVRNLPIVRASEQAVFEGHQSPEEHSQLDSLHRAKVSQASKTEQDTCLCHRLDGTRD